MSGEDLVVDKTEAKLKRHLTDLTTARSLLPIWTDWGVQDSEVWIHSLGVTFWTLLGQQLGFVPVCEVPTPTANSGLLLGDRIRSDAVWLEANKKQPYLLVEFERYNGLEDIEKLTGKVRNLLLAHHRWQEQAQLLVLAYWTSGLASYPPHDALRKIIRAGYTTAAKETVTGSAKGKLLFFQFVLHEGQDRKLRLAEMIERGTP